MAVMIIVPVETLRRAHLGTKRKTGTTPRSLGLSYGGSTIDHMTFDRFNVVRYFTADDTVLAVFQDNAGIDD